MKYIRFNHSFDNLPASTWQLISQIDELKGQLAGSGYLNEQTFSRLNKSVLITSSGASTRIEGSRLSDLQVERLISGLRVSKFTDRDEQEVRGYYELLEKIFSSWESLSLTEGTIKHFHQELLKYVTKDESHRGEYKRIDNKVRLVEPDGEIGPVIFDTTPAVFTAGQMHEIVEWTRQALIKKKTHPLLVIAQFIVVFLQIHPFTDGNGRLSRILTNLLLLRAGYEFVGVVSHEKLIEEVKTEYYLALRRAQKSFATDKVELVPWLEFFLKIILQQVQVGLELLKTPDVESLLSPSQLKVWQYLQSTDEVGRAQIVQHTQIPQPTVNQVLEKLLKLKVIQRLGQGRATRYRVL